MTTTNQGQSAKEQLKKSHSCLCPNESCEMYALKPSTPTLSSYFSFHYQSQKVFKHRIWPLMYIYWAYTVYGILTGPSLAFALGAFVLTYLYIDLYGAVLHIVLDNPNFLKLPLIGEACLEFQVRCFF